MNMGFLSGVLENVVTLDCGDGFINFASMLKKKTTKLYNLKG